MDFLVQNKKNEIVAAKLIGHLTRTYTYIKNCVNSKESKEKKRKAVCYNHFLQKKKSRERSI
jgi:hypothetical protein